MVKLKDLIPGPAGLRMLGGATLSATIDGIMEAIFASNPTYWSGKFPYVPTWDPYLPPADDWIVLGVSAAPYALGKLTKKPKVADIGGGMLAYAIPMFIHHIIVLVAWWPAAAARATAPIRVSPYPRPAPAPTPTPAQKGAVKFN
jgi:hypothetical protein